jgi:hypothetical protein
LVLGKRLGFHASGRLSRILPETTWHSQFSLWKDHLCSDVHQGKRDGLRWDLLIYVALIAGLPRGELLNTVWADVDFAAKTIDVAAFSQNMTVIAVRRYNKVIFSQSSTATDSARLLTSGQMDCPNSTLFCEFTKAVLKLSNQDHFPVHVEKFR